MAFLIVSSPYSGTDVWLAWIDEQEVRVYTYSPDLEVFALNSGLHADYYYDREMRYREVSVDAAERLIAAGELGRRDLDVDWQRVTIERLAAQPFRYSAADVLTIERSRNEWAAAPPDRSRQQNS